MKLAAGAMLLLGMMLGASSAVAQYGRVIQVPKSGAGQSRVPPRSHTPDPRPVVENPVTNRSALLCFSPFNRKEASSAVQAMDDRWLKSLNCFIAKEGIPVVVIERTTSLGWQVRLRPEGGEGLTAWGERFDFRAPSGEYLDDWGRAIPRRP